MPNRVSHSLLDPYVGPPIKRLYKHLPIPRWYPPEGIILLGHLSALVGGVGLAYSTTTWWGGLLASLGVAGNHLADCLDGTHARATGQCRNGGELLDHFTDPLSFCYWIIGWAVAIERLDLALAAVVILYATALLTSIKAKMIGQFTLASFGPTEFKTILALYGLALSGIVITSGAGVAQLIALWFYVVMLFIGIVQLVVNVILAVRAVNRHGAPADATEWQVSRTLPSRVPEIRAGESEDTA